MCSASDFRWTLKRAAHSDDIRRKEPKKAMTLIPLPTTPPMSKKFWNPDDEILILRGIIKYQKEKGLSYTSKWDAFYLYMCMERSIGEFFSKNQLMNKVKTLKRKYKENLAKVVPFTNTTEEQVFKLSAKIWALADDEDVELREDCGDELLVLEKTLEATLSFPSLGDDQEKSMLLKLKTLDAHKRKQLSREWEALLVEELQLKIKKFTFSKELSNA